MASSTTKGSSVPAAVAPTATDASVSARNKHRSGVVMVVFIALLLDILAFTVILPLLPRLLDDYRAREGDDPNSLLGRTLGIVRGFHDSFRSLSSSTITRNGRPLDVVLVGGALGSMFSLLQFVSSPIIGRLSDTYGRRRILLLSMLGNLVSCALWVFAGDFATFVLSRIIGGLSEGNVQLSIAIVSDVTDEINRSRSLALVGIAFAVGFTVGPPLGAYFASVDLQALAPWLPSWIHPYSAPALFAFVLLAVETVYLARRLPETAALAPTNDTAAALRQPLISPTRTPTEHAVKRNRDLAILNIIHFAHLFLFSGMEYTLTFLTFDIHGFTHADQGKLLAFIGILSAMIQGGYVRRKRRRASDKALALIGMASCAIGLFCVSMSSDTHLTSLLLSPKSWLWAGAAGLAVTSATVVNALTTLSSLVCDSIDEAEARSDRGKVLGQFRSRGQLGRACGPIFTCAMYWWWGGVACYQAGALLMITITAASFYVMPSPIGGTKNKSA